MAYVLGLDLSLRATGFHALGFWGDDDVHVGVKSGLIAVSSTGVERIDAIARKLMPVATDAALVVIEGFSFASQGQAHDEIVGLGYMVRHALWKTGVPYVIVAPSQAKKFVTGKGNAEKSLILREVYKRWGFDAADDNEADACVLAHIGRCLIGAEQPANDAQRDVLEKLRKSHTAELKRFGVAVDGCRGGETR